MRTIILIARDFENIIYAKNSGSFSAELTTGTIEGALKNFLIQKYKPSIQKLKGMEGFKEWFKVLKPHSVDYISEDTFNEIVAFIENGTEKGGNKTHRDDIIKYIQENFNDFVSKFGSSLELFQYKKVKYNQNTEVIALPCYKDYNEIEYQVKDDKWNLLNAIKSEFRLEENEENEIYIHNKEWNTERAYDYADIENGNEKIRKYFKGGIRVFMHADYSMYYDDILLKAAFDEAKDKIDKFSAKKAILSSYNKIEDHHLKHLSTDVEKTIIALKSKTINLEEIAKFSKLITLK